jgi:hypothetical protein
MIINKNGVFHYGRKDNRRTVIDVRKGIKFVIPEKGQNFNGTVKKAVAKKVNDLTVENALYLHDKYGVEIIKVG